MQLSQDIPGLTYKAHAYGQHSLQRVGVWQFASSPAQERSGWWMIFVHGGAWRDPTKTRLDFVPAVRRVLDDEAVSKTAIRGFASIDYRLSPHPSFPQDPTDTPTPELRNARHPDHIQDVRSALATLQDEYGLGDKYVLIGHSAGGSLAFQLLMGSAALGGEPASSLPLPAAVIGVSGIYDIEAIDERHNGNYGGLMTGAFGGDRAVWRAASPACFSGSYKENWGGKRFALLAWSRDDNLVDEPEIDNMAAKLSSDGFADLQVVKDLTGEHDSLWQDGVQLARLVGTTLDRLSSL